MPPDGFFGFKILPNLILARSPT